MESDSSVEEERNRWNKEMVPIRPNINDGDNSDVSDEENISRAARSIESPPESPQGTHFESPPASPNPDKPGTPSPIQSPEDSASYGSPTRSPDSRADSRLRNESPPRSPDSYLPRSPSPVRFANRTPPSEPRSQSPTTNYPRSPSPVQVPSPKNKSLDSIQSPEQIHSPQSPQSIQSPTPASQFEAQSPNSVRSPSPYRSSRRAGSPPDQSSQSPRQDSSPRRFKGRSPSPSQSPQSTNQQRTRRDSHNSDDGRSDISSASSFGSPHQSPAPPQPSADPPLRVKTAAELKSHVEDLSDVSDLDILNSMSDDEMEKPKPKENGDVGAGSFDRKKDTLAIRNSSTGLDADETEQLDFEAEEKEEGECDAPQAVKAQPGPKKGEKKEKEAGERSEGEDDGELKGDELEEGEITDEGENRPEETEPRPVCRFYNRGQCTWGSSCRFVHPGVTDKGNYTMFEMVRPLVPVNGPPMPMYGPPMMDPYRPMMERPMMGPPPVYQAPPLRKEEVPPPVVESAWERGLRQAKEMLRKSTKRKETEVDFEEKKMNLSIGQDELDKENDYYTRSASPVIGSEPDRYVGKGEEKRYRTMSDRFDDYGGGPEGFYYQRNTEQVWHQRPHYDESMRGVYSRSSSGKYYSTSRSGRDKEREKDYYSGEKKSSKKYSQSQREVIVQRPEKTSTSWKEDSPPAKPSRYSEGRKGGSRGDEWADPWMRSKTSPLSRKRSRKASYSSGSSYSSSSSRSSSRSSSSSYSRSRSRSGSSRSRSRSKKPSKLSPPRRLLRVTSPVGKGQKLQGVKAPVMPQSEKKATTMMLMNPPPPSPRPKAKGFVATNPSPPIDRVRSALPTSAKLQKVASSAVAAAMRSARSRSKSSRSSGSSDSSGSSSDSSDSSLSSSSSIRQKRIVIDERLALAQAMNMKVKAMDALKLSGQKQQIKLTLKGTGGDQRTPTVPIIAGKKRPAESPPMDFSPPKAGAKGTPKKTAPSRREELLKQLKAVEDAIARKRSKIS